LSAKYRTRRGFVASIQSNGLVVIREFFGLSRGFRSNHLRSGHTESPPSPGTILLLSAIDTGRVRYTFQQRSRSRPKLYNINTNGVRPLSRERRQLHPIILISFPGRAHLVVIFLSRFSTCFGVLIFVLENPDGKHETNDLYMLTRIMRDLQRRRSNPRGRRICSKFVVVLQTVRIYIFRMFGDGGRGGGLSYGGLFTLAI